MQERVHRGLDERLLREKQPPHQLSRRLSLGDSGLGGYDVREAS